MNVSAVQTTSPAAPAYDCGLRRLARSVPCQLAWLLARVLFPQASGAQASGEVPPDPVVETIGPLVAQLALGGILGFCAGFAIKKIGKVVAILIGVLFVLLQVLAYYEVVVINWAPIAGWWDVVRAQQTVQDFSSVVRSVLFANVPAVVGAVPGFILGLKRG